MRVGARQAPRRWRPHARTRFFGGGGWGRRGVAPPLPLQLRRGAAAMQGDAPQPPSQARARGDDEWSLLSGAGTDAFPSGTGTMLSEGTAVDANPTRALGGGSAALGGGAARASGSPTSDPGAALAAALDSELDLHEACPYIGVDDATGADPQRRTVVLVGPTGHGKSSAGNLLLQRAAFKSGRSACSVTSEATMATSDDGSLSAVDTVGLFDTRMGDGAVLEELSRCVSLARDTGVHAILLVFRADVRFTRAEIQALEALEALFGSSFWRHAVAVFTYGDALVDEYCEDEADDEPTHEAEAARLQAAFERFTQAADVPTDLRRYLDNCRGRTCVLDNSRRAPKAVRAAGRARLQAVIEQVVADNGGEAFTEGLFRVASDAAAEARAAAALATDSLNGRAYGDFKDISDVNRLHMLVESQVRDAVQRAVESRLADMEASVKTMQVQIDAERAHRAALQAQSEEFERCAVFRPDRACAARAARQLWHCRAGLTLLCALHDCARTRLPHPQGVPALPSGGAAPPGGAQRTPLSQPPGTAGLQHHVTGDCADAGARPRYGENGRGASSRAALPRSSGDPPDAPCHNSRPRSLPGGVSKVHDYALYSTVASV